MKSMPGFTDFFMSPVTGRINLFQFPDIPDDYIIVGGLDDRPYLSPIVIDLRLEIIELRNRLSRTSFILQHASPNFDKSQALDELIPGILRHTDGVVSIAMLPYHQVWLGNEDNYPESVDRIWDDGVGHGNLPAYTPTESNMIWVMNEEGIPILSNALTEAQTSILDIISSITSILGDIIGMISDIASLISSILSIYDWITGADAEFDDLQFQIDATQEQIGILEEAIGELEAQMEAQIEAIAEINLSIEAILEAIAELNISVEALIEAVAAINAQITGILTAITDIQTAITGILTSITDIEANITSIFSSITDINIALGGIDLRLDGIDVSLDGLQVQIDTGLESGLGHLADLQLQIDTGIDSGMDHLATINSQIDDINSSITDINTSITDITTSITDINIEIADLATAIGDGSVTLIGDVTGAGNVGTPFGTVLTLTLDEIPLAAADVNINTHKLTNIVDPVNPQDAATKSYVDSFVAGGAVTLTGDVTGSGVVGTPFATTLTLTLDQVPLALGDISANINKITDLVDPLDPQDAATKNYVDGLVGDGTIELTGNVLGTGVVGTPFNTDLASNILTTTGDQTFSYPSAASSTAFALINTCTPTLLTPSTMELTLENSIGSGYASILSSSHSLGTFPDGVFQFYAFTPGLSTLIYTATSDLVTFNIPVTMTTDLSMAANKITNVVDPTDPQDAATKNYVDGLVSGGSIELTGNVLGVGTVGTPFNTDLASNILTTTGGQTFSYPTASDSAAFALINTFTPTILTPSNMEFTLENSIGSGYTSILSSSHSLGTFPDGVFDFIAFTSSDTQIIYRATPDLFTFNIPVTMTTALSMANNEINNLVMNLSPQIYDAVNVEYLSNQITDTVNNLTLDQLGCDGNVDIDSHYILGVLDPVSDAQAANKHYVDNTVLDHVLELTGDVSGTGAIGAPIDTTLELTLDEIACVGDVDINSHYILGVLDPVSAAQAANKNYVDTKFAAVPTAVTLTGAVTGSGVTGTPFATTLATTLNNVPAPTGNLSLNSFKITSLLDPTSAQDGATKNYVDNGSLYFYATNPSSITNTTVSATTETKLNGISLSAGVGFTGTADNTFRYDGTVTRPFLLNANISFSANANTNVYMSIVKNGVAVSYFGGAACASGGIYDISGSVITSAATNDTFSVYVYSNFACTLSLRWTTFIATPV